jgi:exopolyphosphatase/guanosine-5'-triphosphate,3'-diphosphate pyrophosphatase
MPKDQVVAAAIALGSNSFRLLIGSRTEQGLVCLLKKRVKIRLAKGLNNNGIFTSESICQALETLDIFRAEIDRLGITVLRCCGTEALRKSANPEDLTVPAEKILGVPIEILSGKEEAGLCCLGVVDALDGKLSFPCLIADLGGGSTELILLKSPQTLPVARSLPVGVVMYAERNRAARVRDLHLLADGIIKLLREAELPSPPMLVGTGGTAGALASLNQGLTSHKTDKIQGYFLTRKDIDGIYTSLAALSRKQLKERQGLEAGREDIIIPGLEIYQEVLATIGCEGMIVSDAGLLEGILLSITRA